MLALVVCGACTTGFPEASLRDASLPPPSGEDSGAEPDAGALASSDAEAEDAATGSSSENQDEPPIVPVPEDAVIEFPSVVMEEDTQSYVGPTETAVDDFAYSNIEAVNTSLVTLDPRGEPLPEVDVTVHSSEAKDVVLYRGRTDESGALSLAFTWRRVDGEPVITAELELYEVVTRALTAEERAGAECAVSLVPVVYTEVEGT